MKKKYILLSLLVIFSIFFVSLFSNNTIHHNRKHQITARIEKNKLLSIRDEQTKKSGSYIVGKDIPEGEYVLVNIDKKNEDKNIGDYTVFEDSSKKVVLDCSEITVNTKELLNNKKLLKNNFTINDTQEYSSNLIELKKNEVIEINNLKLYPAKLRIKPDLSKIVEGTYKVGRDIPEGKYEIKSYNLTSKNLHTIWIMNNVDPEIDIEESLITKYQDYTKQIYPKEMMLKQGEYITFSDLIFSKQNE